MKKLINVIILFMLILMITACSDKIVPPNSNIPDDNRPSLDEAINLVVYFSQPDNVDDSVVEINGETLGNTQYMAYVIQENTDANIFRIIPEVAYPIDHSELTDLAREEKADNARPAIKGTIENFAQYENIFVGYPNWWGDMPMILYTFFESYDFSGKKIIPFNTHGGSGFSGTIGAIRNLEPNATIENGLSISRDDIQMAEQQIIDWIVELGLSKPTPEQGKALIVYFSWSTSGNTKRMANYIAQRTNGDVVEIIPVVQYPTVYSETTEVAQIEKDNNARPEILNPLSAEVVAQYETIFVGYPIWWWSAPMIIGTFLESYEWSENVNIYPFSQSASMNVSQFETSVEFVKSCAKGATVNDGLFARASNTDAIDTYLTSYGF